MFQPSDFLSLDLVQFWHHYSTLISALAILLFAWLCLRASNNSAGHLFIITFDYLFSVLLFRRSGITVSSESAMARNAGKRWGCLLCKLLDRLDTNHCTLAIQADIDRANLALKTLQNAQK